MSLFLDRAAQSAAISDPLWTQQASTRCPDQAAEVHRLNAALQALPKDAPTSRFVDLYEQLLDARDRLYEAWITMEMGQAPDADTRPT